jgi:hypothetical protein
MADNKLEPNQFVLTGDVGSWLLDPPHEPGWIFIGRLLRRHQDAVILENPKRARKRDANGAVRLQTDLGGDAD